ncbi:hypothetical protein PUN28_001782 [Cardiocondyla obscurior]|uniref:Uncharacterized protein n=1 Tax=Cardiocondyla obscurior TaxID=286306 RepID=A0AAW2GR83_9HYME
MRAHARLFTNKAYDLYVMNVNVLYFKLSLPPTSGNLSKSVSLSRPLLSLNRGATLNTAVPAWRRQTSRKIDDEKGGTRRTRNSTENRETASSAKIMDFRVIDFPRETHRLKRNRYTRRFRNSNYFYNVQ